MEYQRGFLATGNWKDKEHLTRILVTGGSGFIGSNLVESLREHHTVVNFDLQPPRHEELRDSWIHGSVEDEAAVLAVYADFRPEVVYHLAARTDLDGRSVEDYSINTAGVSNIIRGGSSIGGNLQSVYLSTRLVFAIDQAPRHLFDYSPTTPYGESKVAAEEIVRARAHDAGSWTMMRPTSIWGPWFATPYRDFFDRVRRGHYVNVARHNPRKSYGFVGNSVHQLMALMNHPRAAIDQQTFWLTDYPPLVLNDWAEKIAEEFGQRRPATLPEWTLRTAAVMGDVAKHWGHSGPPLTTFRLNNLLTNMVYDTVREQELFGQLPFSMEEGVERTVAWMRNQERGA